VEEHGRKCLLIEGDVGQEDLCRKAIDQTVKKFGRIDILVNNAAEQHPQDSIEEISEKQLERTFRTNIFPFLHGESSHDTFEKGRCNHQHNFGHCVQRQRAFAGLFFDQRCHNIFTRSLSQTLADRCIRVNGVAPGPVWTPLIPSTFPAKEVATFGSDVPLGRAGQPEEIAPSYVFLASDDSSYMTGQVLHPNGGTIVNG